MAFMDRATCMWLVEHSVVFNRFLVRQLNERLGHFMALLEYDRMLDAAPRLARCIASLFNPVLYPGGGEAPPATFLAPARKRPMLEDTALMPCRARLFALSSHGGRPCR